MATGQSCDLVTATASLQKCREKLLETNARNSLLNFKINAKSRVVRIFGTSIEGLQDLVFRQKVVGFDFVLPLNEDELASRNLDREEAEKVNQDPERCSKERGVPVNFDLPLKKVNSTQIAIRETRKSKNYQLLTPYFREELLRRVKKIHDYAKSKYEETGVKTSYLVIGFLKWKDPGSRKDELAPLLSIPVNILDFSLLISLFSRYP